MADWKDILNDKDSPLSEEDLLKYIDVNTSANDKKQIEDIAANDFDNDALEGLKYFKDPAKARRQTRFLQRRLQKTLGSKNRMKTRSKYSDLNWIIFATIIALLTCVLAYIVIKMKS